MHIVRAIFSYRIVQFTRESIIVILMTVRVREIIGRLLEASDCYSIMGYWNIRYGTILHAALAGGHEKIVKILLDKGADVNTQGGEYSNALQAASSGGH